MTSKEIKDIVPETIDTMNRQSKDSEKIETIYPESLNVPDYAYWASQNNLDADIAIRNLPTPPTPPANSSNIKTWAFTITSTGYQSITWIWFTPKIIKLFSSISSSWNEYWSEWSSGDSISTSKCLFGWLVAWVYVTRLYFWASIILVRYDASITDSVISSFDADWFTINTLLYFGSTTYVKYECYW